MLMIFDVSKKASTMSLFLLSSLTICLLILTCFFFVYDDPPPPVKHDDPPAPWFPEPLLNADVAPYIICSDCGLCRLMPAPAPLPPLR